MTCAWPPPPPPARTLSGCATAVCASGPSWSGASSVRGARQEAAAGGGGEGGWQRQEAGAKVAGCDGRHLADLPDVAGGLGAGRVVALRWRRLSACSLWWRTQRMMMHNSAAATGHRRNGASPFCQTLTWAGKYATPFPAHCLCHTEPIVASACCDWHVGYGRQLRHRGTHPMLSCFSYQAGVRPKSLASSVAATALSETAGVEKRLQR